ncbi:hypothetical protein SDC9_106252 [bioreactor metagenome]|uniref:PIN domain-containing protein n=1 Tax=bioreactor metagenome TaxID=1076179 RepID=A0A645B1T5_9ZZZZ
MNNIFDLNEYKFSKEENYLFDANVWLNVFAPFTFETKKVHDIYSKMFRDILESNCNIYTTNIIVSEVVNRISQNQYKLCRNKYFEKGDPTLGNFDHKTFRETDFYKDEIAYDISNQIQNIASYSKLCDVSTGNNDFLYDVAEIFEKCTLDFNDIIYLKTCEENSLALITHDRDFKDCEIKIITANKAMLESN